MIIDILLVVSFCLAIFFGYRRGFLQTIFSTIGYIGGGLLGLILALEYSPHIQNAVYRFLAILISIFIVAEIGRRVLGATAKFFRTKLLWAPFRFVDSLLGVALELVRVGLLAYLIASLILWAPWNSAREQVAQSKIYPKISAHVPNLLSQLRVEIEKKLDINLPK